MTIRTEDVAGMDFSDVAGPERIGPVTLGEVREDFMLPLGLSARALARALGGRRTASPPSWHATAVWPPGRRSCWASGLASQ
jgi:hypothetical protein